MGQPSISGAIGYLTAAGIRADRGYPGTGMPQLTGPVAAVNVQQAGPAELTLVAAVCSPQAQGVAACEDMAAKVAAAWTSAGAVCSWGNCGFDGQSGFYILRVQGIWTEETAE